MTKKILTMNEVKERPFPVQQYTGKVISLHQIDPGKLPPASEGTKAKGPMITTENFEVVAEAKEIKRLQEEAAASRAKVAEGILGVITGETRDGIREKQPEEIVEAEAEAAEAAESEEVVKIEIEEKPKKRKTTKKKEK